MPHPSLYVPKALHLVTQIQLFFNDCYSELIAYTALAYSSFHDAYQFQGHAYQ